MAIHNDPLYGMPVGMGYVPWQTWSQPYAPEKALNAGTIFAPLDLPFYGCIPKGYFQDATDSPASGAHTPEKGGCATCRRNNMLF